MGASEIGRRLKKARLDAGLKQADVAKILGITYQAISNYERGINRVDTDTLQSLCNVYGIKVSDLLHTPAWTDEMISMYRSANTDEEKQRYLSIWGTPDFLIEETNNQREPDTEKFNFKTDFTLTPQELTRISAAMSKMNEEGRERAVELVEDLAAGGRYKKTGADNLGKEA